MAVPSIPNLDFAAEPIPNRRCGKRIPLHWCARLIRSNGAILTALTENFSSTGFYCLLNEKLTPGEEIECHISIPLSNNSKTRMTMLCRGRVARVEFVGSDRYGVGYQIEDYQVMSE